MSLYSDVDSSVGGNTVTNLEPVSSGVVIAGLGETILSSGEGSGWFHHRDYLWFHGLV